MTIDTKVRRPEYPHVENLERVLVHDPDFLNRAVTLTEKLHGFNARVGRDADGTLWIGTRTQDYELGAADVPALQGFRDYARETFGYLAPGVTVYGEWAGKGVQKGIDYGAPTFYLFAERTGDGPVLSSAAVLDQHWVQMGEGGFVARGANAAPDDGVDAPPRHPAVTTVPVIYEGSHARLDVLDELRKGGSIVAPEQPIEGVVIAPVEPVFDKYGHQLIAKYKSPQFSELTHVRKETAPVDMTRASGFAAEYVNEERLAHVLQQVVEADPSTETIGRIVVQDINPLDVQHTGAVLKAMFEDVVREGRADYEALEAADRRLVGKAVNKETLRLLGEARDLELREALTIVGQEGPE